MNAAESEVVLGFGHLEVWPQRWLAVVDGRPLMLSVREFDLLVVLVERPERVVRREELFRLVWGGQMRKEDRSVDVYVAKLRAKLAAALPAWRFIHTHFGFGYRFAPEPVTGSSQEDHR